MASVLLQTIREEYIARSDQTYGSIITVLQSSGTGKSRTVHEMRNLVFVIPFNVRKRDPCESIRIPSGPAVQPLHLFFRGVISASRR